MKKFLDENFLLQTETAERLYHEHAAKMPIIDYHCHIPPQEIADNKQFANMTEIWLKGDHYKWRGMRTNGVNEKFITGDASDWEKFEKWAETVPYTLRNPLYHWTHLELKKPFGVEKLLNKSTAKEIWEECNEKLQTPEFSCRGIIEQANVEVICTTDDPIDSLEHHLKIKADGFATKVLPSWRPDKAMAVENQETYNQYIDALEKAAEKSIGSYTELLEALRARHDFFNEVGCRLSDHGLEEFYAEDYTESEVAAIFVKVRTGKELSRTEVLKFKSAMLYEFGVMDHEKGWTQQFHVGAIRNNSSRLFTKLGPDTGFDSIGDWLVADKMSKFLDRLDREDKLTKTILYNLNGAHNDVYATMIGNFQDGSVAGKMQFGSGWWFLDQKDGMEKQMNALSNLGLLSRFVGMLTDSRSFLSYSRHEYFRRTLCNLIGNDVENGEIPADMDLLGSMVENISYNNARDYFNF
ncbi:glucuronate isomerase [Puteibacter caeruleilacunae]|nr:glucuronate isomerase [Puteibacter caeruleilacunae]